MCSPTSSHIYLPCRKTSSVALDPPEWPKLKIPSLPLRLNVTSTCWDSSVWSFGDDFVDNPVSVLKPCLPVSLPSPLPSRLRLLLFSFATRFILPHNSIRRILPLITSTHSVCPSLGFITGSWHVQAHSGKNLTEVTQSVFLPSVINLFLSLLICTFFSEMYYKQKKLHESNYWLYN